MDQDEIFHYVIARPWDDRFPNNLCIYAYGTQVHKGTLQNANWLLKYVNSGYSLPNRDRRLYSIYKVQFTKMEELADVTE